MFSFVLSLYVFLKKFTYLFSKIDFCVFKFPIWGHKRYQFLDRFKIFIYSSKVLRIVYGMSGSYNEYKSCTTKFVQWIKSAASCIQKASKSLPNTLAALQERTKIIIEYPNNIISLGDDLLGGFQESMLSGFRAIQLRKYVHALFLVACEIQTRMLMPATTLY